MTSDKTQKRALNVNPGEFKGALAEALRRGGASEAEIRRELRTTDTDVRAYNGRINSNNN